jgi:hypothetical protein
LQFYSNIREIIAKITSYSHFLILFKKSLGDGDGDGDGGSVSETE